MCCRTKIRIILTQTVTESRGLSTLYGSACLLVIISVWTAFVDNFRTIIVPACSCFAFLSDLNGAFEVG